MKFLNCLLVISLLCSCSKSKSDGAENILSLSGAVNGNIKAYNKYGNEDSNYNDITIKLIDKQGKVFSGLVNGNGTFRFENVLLGDITLAITKPGYGFTDSVKYNHQESADTLTNIYLIEEFPFSCYLVNVDYLNSVFSISTLYRHQSTDSFMVSESYCFSKEPEVSINHTRFLLNRGVQSHVQALTGHVSGRSTLPFKLFTNAGFKEGDQIYVTVIPSISKIWSYYYEQNRNYEVIHYKIGNASNVVSFTLRK